MAKKWQDVEFVDYKERQKRRRLRKREAVQEELASAVGSRLNISLIVFVVSSFIILMGAGVYFLTQEKDYEDDRASKMYVKAKTIAGDVRFRKNILDEPTPFDLQIKVFDTGIFQTGQASRLELETFDSIFLKLGPETEVSLDSIEVFSANKRSKTTLSVEAGMLVVDALRSAGGLMELHGSGISIYAGKALFKVEVTPAQLKVKVSQGVLSLEGAGSQIELTRGQEVLIKDQIFGVPTRFNAAAETF